MANEKRLIDANAAIKDIDNYYNNSPFPHPGTTWLRGLELAAGLLLKAPTVDAVEVVRCKDCKHHKLPAVLTQKYGEPGTLTCHNWHSPCNKRNVKADAFCSYGERKDNGK